MEKLRLIKSAAEMELMRAAGALSGDAFREVMARTRPGMSEAQLEAIVEYHCKMVCVFLHS